LQERKELTEIRRAERNRVDIVVDIVAEQVELAAQTIAAVNRSFFLRLMPISLVLPTSGRRFGFGRKQNSDVLVPGGPGRCWPDGHTKNASNGVAEVWLPLTSVSVIDGAR